MMQRTTFPEFEIQNRSIGYQYDPLVIAEIGINHGGSLSEAKKIVDQASLSGVEIIKHQTHIPEYEMSLEAKKVIPSHTKESIYEIISQCSLTEEEEIELQSYVVSKNMIFISSPFSREAAVRLNKMNVPAYKIGSGECNNYPLLDLIASFKKPIILSTGMNTIQSIKKAVSIIESYNVPYALLHCTNVYPTPYNLVRLEAINELKKEFPKAVVGLSDHTTSNYPCIASVALGASILERHFTDSMDRIGPDIVCSMDPEACKELIGASRIIKQSRGGIKGAAVEEKPTIDFAYASVVSIKDIRKGERLDRENIWVKRPGTGDFLAEEYSTLIGREAKKDIDYNTQIKKEHIL
jgi:sialic acid synthase SpsE